MSEKTGGPAFPNTDATIPKEGDYWNYQGMTLRDYFAAKALQGLVSIKLTEQNIELFRRDADGNPSVSLTAYYIADAMLEARK